MVLSLKQFEEKYNMSILLQLKIYKLAKQYFSIYLKDDDCIDYKKMAINAYKHFLNLSFEFYKIINNPTLIDDVENFCLDDNLSDDLKYALKQAYNYDLFYNFFPLIQTIILQLGDWRDGESYYRNGVQQTSHKYFLKLFKWICEIVDFVDNLDEIKSTETSHLEKNFQTYPILQQLLAPHFQKESDKSASDKSESDDKSESKSESDKKSQIDEVKNIMIANINTASNKFKEEQL